MTKKVPPTSSLPLSVEQLDCLQAATSTFSSRQFTWLSGYFWGLGSYVQPTASTIDNTTKSITLLSASQTGNARRLAEQMRDDLMIAKLNVVFIQAGDYNFKNIAQEKLLLVITSTQGEGEPPEEAMALYQYLFSKKAPSLEYTQFAVFGLGDSSYKYFAKIGKDFDQRLAELGAKRLHERVDADIEEYQEKAKNWRYAIVKLLKARLVVDRTSQHRSIIGTINKLDYHHDTKTELLKAQLSVSKKITSRLSLKDVRHLEIAVADSRLSYKPGDTLGVWYENDPALINELLELLLLKGDEVVKMKGQKLTLRTVLKKHYELTQNTPPVVEKYANLAQNQALLKIINNKMQLHQFALTTTIVDMIHLAPSKLRVDQLLALLRPLKPRIYSIASAQAEVGEEVHLTVGVVRYEINGQQRTGGCSSYLADRLAPEDEVRVFIEHNDNFRLPQDPNVPIIMIGPGTGIAPFRAFMQQREVDRAPGRNWLFFGNQHLNEDFLYQVEWQRYVKNGLITQIDVAWSRDQAKKVYIQERIRDKGPEVWRWLQQGAHIYICGDVNSIMISDVEQSLVNIIAQNGDMDREQANNFLSELRMERRYQRDIY